MIQRHPRPGKLAVKVLRRLLARRRYFKRANEKRSQPRTDPTARRPDVADLPDAYFNEE